MTTYERIRFLREKRGFTQKELAEKIGYKSRATMCKIEAGERDINRDKIVLLANVLDTTPAYLMGWDDVENSLYAPTISDDDIEFPVIAEVAAGFDKVAVEEWTGDKIKVPRSYLKGRKPDEFFVLRVKGDSMYPMYIDGDKVLIQKQNAIDYSGQIAVAIYNDECGTIKKIEYKKDSVGLIPVNPQYQPTILKDTEIERMHILGVPKLIIREIND